ncbi:MAG: serine/threonine-protein kinase [Hylemonella sp.]|uniref:serine/threonine protein kinase n=1 Tax=Hylemonella sp. TaxID=2066020 RepID=UPI0022BA901D|nr:serine/threonine-protein kinase [Hylemonella sp.]MCZ8252605.1 serine/threonine-protein kinase [Hylemonella sp.]
MPAIPDALEPVAPADAPAPLAHADALPPGTLLAEFEIQGLLGVGGFGLVYRAYDHSLHRTVAIKEYMPAALAARPAGLSLSIRSSADQETYDSGLRSFMAEARLLAQFDHPSLVKVYRFWEANNTAYMVMPLYSGVTLKQARAQMLAPPPEDWLRIVLWSILQALQLLHEHDTLHRDVSPDNIFLQDAGPPVLLDLGAARRAITDRSRKLTAILKVNYAPIEQYAEADDLKQGPWSDLYALAAVVYGCLRNDPPLPATTRVVSDSMPAVQSLADTLEAHFGLRYSPAFVRAIDHALAVQPTQRTQSVHDFVTEMALQAPSGLVKFDWRTALGANLVATQVSESTDGSDLQTTVQNPAQTQPVDRPASPAVPEPVFPARSRWRPRRGLVLMLLFALMLSAAVWVYEETLRNTLLVEAPERPTVPVITTSPPPVLEEAQGAAAEGAPLAESPLQPAPRPTGQTAVTRSAPKKPAAPKELCASASFWRKPICMFQECLKPENTSHPMCVESRQRSPSPGE